MFHSNAYLVVRVCRISHLFDLRTPAAGRLNIYRPETHHAYRRPLARSLARPIANSVSQPVPNEVHRVFRGTCANKLALNAPFTFPCLNQGAYILKIHIYSGIYYAELQRYNVIQTSPLSIDLQVHLEKRWLGRVVKYALSKRWL